MRNELGGTSIFQDTIGLFVIAPILLIVALIWVAVCFVLPLIANRLRPKSKSKLAEKARAAFRAADLGWLALACGPLIGLLIAWVGLSLLPLFSKLEITLSEFVNSLLLGAGAGLVAGLILASACWLYSSLLGKVRQATTGLSGVVYDPDVDGPM